jgi:hypothetical protein
MKNVRVRILVSSLAVLAVALAMPALAQDDAKKYEGANSCKICHNKPAEGAQWNQWHGTAHAKALETLKTPEAKAVAEKAGVKTPPAESAECLKCHVTGYDAEKKAAPAKIKLEEGVGCESCHGPGSAHTALAKKNMGKAGDTWGAADTIVTQPDEESCKKCHNPESPTFKGFDFKEMNDKIAHPNPKKAGKAAPAEKKS